MDDDLRKPSYITGPLAVRLALQKTSKVASTYHAGKKKSRIALDDDYNSMELDQLSNKEMVWTQDQSYTGSNNNYSETEGITTTQTFVKQ